MERFKMFLESEEPLDIFDSKEGYGQVPNNINVDYMGFKKFITPLQFRSLVPMGVSGPKTKEFIINALNNGEKIGPPFLQVEWDEEEKLWIVLDHEGRSRVDAIAKVYGQRPIEVHFFPIKGLRARDITPEMKKASFIKQDDKGLWRSGLKDLVKPITL